MTNPDPSNHLQMLVDGINAAEQRIRAGRQATLGRLIQEVAALPDTAVILGFGSLSSYRGHYCDLAIEPSGGSATKEIVLASLREARGAIFEGYKGGEFPMHDLTPVWLSPWGEASGLQVIALVPVAPSKWALGVRKEDASPDTPLLRGGIEA